MSAESSTVLLANTHLFLEVFIRISRPEERGKTGSSAKGELPNVFRMHFDMSVEISVNSCAAYYTYMYVPEVGYFTVLCGDSECILPDCFVFRQQGSRLCRVLFSLTVFVDQFSDYLNF